MPSVKVLSNYVCIYFGPTPNPYFIAFSQQPLNPEDKFLDKLFTCEFIGIA